MPIYSDSRPSDYEYAILSNYVYNDKTIKISDIVNIPSENGQSYWRIKKVLAGPRNYFGVIFYNQVTHQHVVAHKGTDSFLSLIEDIHGVFFNGISPQKESAYQLTEIAIEFARDVGGGLSFTGHSLGAYLAELSLFYCHISFYPGAHEFDIREVIHAVTFESPGTQEIMKKLQSNLPHNQIILSELDITNYLSYPNLVNTCGLPVGTIYGLAPNIGKWGNIHGIHLKKVHTMQNIIPLFQNESFHSNRRYMLDWPTGNQRHEFFNHVKFSGNEYIWDGNEQVLLNNFNLVLSGHFRIDRTMGSPYVLPLRHFNPAFRQWLKDFYNMPVLRFSSPGVLEGVKRKLSEIAPVEIIEYLLACMVKVNQFNKEWYIELTNGIEGISLFKIRREISTWLSNNDDGSGNILRVLAEFQRTSDIKATLLESGAILDETGEIINPKVRGVDTYIPYDTNPEMLSHFQQASDHLFETIKKNRISIVASVAEKGAVLKGKITNPEVIAVAFRVDNAPLAADSPERVYDIGVNFSADTLSEASGSSSSMAYQVAKQREQSGLSAPTSASKTTSNSIQGEPFRAK